MPLATNMPGTLDAEAFGHVAHAAQMPDATDFVQISWTDVVADKNSTLSGV